MGNSQPAHRQMRSPGGRGLSNEKLQASSRSRFKCCGRNLQHWNGELMPTSRSWVHWETAALSGQDRAIARLALLLAKAPQQVDGDTG